MESITENDAYNHIAKHILQITSDDLEIQRADYLDIPWFTLCCDGFEWHLDYLEQTESNSSLRDLLANFVRENHLNVAEEHLSRKITKFSSEAVSLARKIGFSTLDTQHMVLSVFTPTTETNYKII